MITFAQRLAYGVVEACRAAITVGDGTRLALKRRAAARTAFFFGLRHLQNIPPSTARGHHANPTHASKMSLSDPSWPAPAAPTRKCAPPLFSIRGVRGIYYRPPFTIFYNAYSMAARYPQRIICLTEETCETLYLLGAQDRIVGISGFTVRPPQARKEKPKIAAFTSAKIDKILALEPDLVLGFSDMQADIAAELVRHGIAVYVFNQRSVNQILDMILCLGSLMGVTAGAKALVQRLEKNLGEIRRATVAWGVRPSVYFEEWDEPLISGIRWVSELIDIAGGQDCFVENSRFPDAKRRIIADANEVVRRRPDIIIGSWCGRRFRSERVGARDGWRAIPAVAHGEVHEIKSSDILQPGPAALTDGVRQLHAIIARWQQRAGNVKNPAAGAKGITARAVPERRRG
jgi:iron complex transport system substrate-binding protein